MGATLSYVMPRNSGRHAEISLLDINLFTHDSNGRLQRIARRTVDAADYFEAGTRSVASDVRYLLGSFCVSDFDHDGELECYVAYLALDDSVQRPCIAVLVGNMRVDIMITPGADSYVVRRGRLEDLPVGVRSYTIGRLDCLRLMYGIRTTMTEE
ncbi:MAG: hypothetical protein ABIR47_02430 [Candidatus Kapaibacterium sp.]